MGIYDKALLSLYNLSNTKFVKTPALFLKYASYLLVTHDPRIGYQQSLSPEYVHWKEKLSLPLSLLIIGGTYYIGTQIKQHYSKRQTVQEISSIRK